MVWKMFGFQTQRIDYEELWCPTIGFQGGYSFKQAVIFGVPSRSRWCLYILIVGIYSTVNVQKPILEYDKTYGVDEHQMENILMVVHLVFVISCVNKNVCIYIYILIYLYLPI